jgi:hypothetical protein
VVLVKRCAGTRRVLMKRLGGFLASLLCIVLVACDSP